MLIIQHRVNTVAQLQTTPNYYGVEVDVRDKLDTIILQHDAYKNGEPWNTYLQHYQHQTLIVNVKTEGIEQTIIDTLNAQKLTDYFLLDVSLPMLVKLTTNGFNKVAIRYSEYEPIQLASAFINKATWVWVDCFTQLPFNDTDYNLLKKHFKICLVSPELQGHSVELITEFKTKLLKYPVDAVCTKYPMLWS